MTFTVEIAWLTAVMLISVRLGALFVLTPIMGGGSVPLRVRVVLVIALSATLVSVLNVSKDIPDLTILTLFSAILKELFIGALLAFFVFCAFAAFSFAGRIVDMQIGFGVASLIDPVTRTQSPLLGAAFQLLAVIVFFAVDGHHLILRMLAESIRVTPPGTFVPALDLAWLIASFGTVFTLGLTLVVPVVVLILLIDLCLALVSKTMPQMNVFIVAIPLKVLIGLAFLSIVVPQMGGIINKIFTAMFFLWQQALGLNG